GRTILNAQAIHSVRVIAAPDLGSIVKHSAIKPSAAAAAPFDEDVGIIPVEAFQHLVNTQDIAVIELALPVRRQSGGPHLRETTVHIPLEIGDIGTGKHLSQFTVNIIPDLLPGEIQYQLAAATGIGTVGRTQSPIRMLRVQLA